MSDSTKAPKARSTGPKPGTVAFRAKMLAMGKANRLTPGGALKPTRSKAVPGRVVSVLPVDIAEGLDVLAVERFGGNRTAAVTAAVQLALVVYNHPANRDRLVSGASDALKALTVASDELKALAMGSSKDGA